MGKGAWILCLALVVASVFAWRQGVRVPHAWNPWAVLDVQEPPNFLTAYKLGRLQDDPQRCAQALATSDLRYRLQAHSSPQAPCPLENVVRVEGSSVRLSSSFLASCPLAVAYALFERHALQPAAQRAFTQAVVQIDHLGSFACRNVYNRKVGRLSQHATANALDIAGFRLADGQRVDVLKDWPGEGAKARFLRALHAGACDSFNTVLGPDYNAAHRNHFHVDMGSWHVCR